MKFILLSLALAATAVTHSKAEGSCFAMHGTSSSGTLEPAGVRTSTDCHIILAADSGPKLRVTLTNIDMPYTGENYDYYRDEYNPYYEEINLDRPQFDDITCEEWLEVRDGPSQDSKLLGEYCGDKELFSLPGSSMSLPITLVSSGKFVWVRFKTNHPASKATFHLEYHSESSDTICHMQAGDCPRDEICVFDGVYDKVLVHKCAKRFAPGTLGCLDDSWCMGTRTMAYGTPGYCRQADNGRGAGTQCYAPKGRDEECDPNGGQWECEDGRTCKEWYHDDGELGEGHYCIDQNGN